LSLAVGVDLGGTHLRAALVDVSIGQILAEEKVDTGDARTPSKIADLLAKTVSVICARAGDATVEGVGIGIAAMLRGSGVVANAPNLGWREVDLRALLEPRLAGRRIGLYNDLKAIAWGEYRFGGGRGTRTMLCVYLGTGIGCGIVVDGRLHLGDGNVAGEIGHTKVVLGPAARVCGCGQRGCVEAYAGGRNLEHRVREELGAGARSLAIELAGGDPARVHPGHVDEAARKGDPYARGLWAEIAPLVGAALANAVTLINPSRLVLGGGLWRGVPELRRLVREAFDGFVNVPAGEGFLLADTELADDAGVLGSSALAAAG
jgi:glucokinase